MSGSSGEKTEKATPKKREDERERGNILKSHDLSTAAVLLLFITLIKFFGDYIGKSMSGIVREYLTMGKELTNATLTAVSIQKLALRAVTSGLKVVLPIFGIAVLSTIAVQLAQTRFLFTTKTLEWKLDKLNPINGLKKMFSMKTVMELIKSMLKVVIVMAAIWQEISSLIKDVPYMATLPLVQAAPLLFQNITSVAMKCAVVLFLLALADLIYQWWSYEKEMKMTKQEVKEESKLSEGNPQTKSRIRQKQRQMSMMRMMSDVAKADVVVTNPTHFAVALRYRSKKDKAPVVLAKGQDYIAQKMKEKAKEHKVIIVENRPLARALYANAEIGRAIPPDLYQAVAEVLAYVAKVKSTRF